jgi:hypothetical protein
MRTAGAKGSGLQDRRLLKKGIRKTPSHGPAAESGRVRDQGGARRATPRGSPDQHSSFVTQMDALPAVRSPAGSSATPVHPNGRLRLRTAACPQSCARRGKGGWWKRDSTRELSSTRGFAMTGGYYNMDIPPGRWPGQKPVVPFWRVPRPGLSGPDATPCARCGHRRDSHLPSCFVRGRWWRRCGCGGDTLPD